MELQKQKQKLLEDQKINSKKYEEWKNLKNLQNKIQSTNVSNQATSSSSKGKSTHQSSQSKDNHRSSNNSKVIQNENSNIRPKEIIRGETYKEEKKIEKKSQELTEEDKRKMIELIEMNANIGYLMIAETQKKNNDQYDPLDARLSTKQESTEKNNINLILEKKIRNKMGITDNVEEIKRKIELQAKIEKENQKKEMELQKKRDIKMNQKKETLKMINQTSKPKIVKDINKEAEIRKLKNKLIEKQQKSQKINKEQPQVQAQPQQIAMYYCSSCQRRHATDFHKQLQSQSNGKQLPQQVNEKQQKILTKLDEESRELKPTVNIINNTQNMKPTMYNKPPQLPKQLPKQIIDTKPKQTQSQIPPPKIQNTQNQQQRPIKVAQFLGKRDLFQRRKQSYSNDNSVYDDEEESDLSDFIVSDNEYDPLETGGSRINYSKVSEMIRKKFGPRRDYGGDDYNSSDMEAGYDDIEREERMAAKIARKEDAEQLKLIQREEEEERRLKKLKKMEKKRQKLQGNHRSN